MKLQTERFVVMGGPAILQVWCESDVDFRELVKLIRAELERLERDYSRFRQDSLLSQLNRGEFNNRALPTEMSALLNYAQHAYEVSDQLFDITTGVLRRVWDFRSGVPPTRDQVDSIMKFVGWQKLNWDGQCLSLPEGMELDLGGLVKEFAVDRVVSLLKAQQVIGLVNLAGDIGVSGVFQNQPWPIKVTHPRAEGAIAGVELFTGTITGSGDYERFFIHQDRRYFHILRPDTGFPPQESMVSVNVLADSCLLAGTISTVAMLKGKEALGWLEEMSLPYMAIDQAMNVVGTLRVES